MRDVHRYLLTVTLHELWKNVSKTILSRTHGIGWNTMQDVLTLQCRTFRRSQSTAKYIRFTRSKHSAVCCNISCSSLTYVVMSLYQIMKLYMCHCALACANVLKAHFDCFYLLSRKCIEFQTWRNLCVHVVYYSPYSSQSVWSAWQWRLHGVPHHRPEVIQCAWWEGHAGEDTQHLTVCMQHCAHVHTLCGNVAIGPVVGLWWCCDKIH